MIATHNSVSTPSSAATVNPPSDASKNASQKFPTCPKSFAFTFTAPAELEQGQTTTSDNPPKDADYYWDTVVFLVEGQLFKVPRWYFTKFSHIFQTTFSLPPGDQPVEGSDDEHPFELQGIKKVDFKNLMKVIYPCSTSLRSVAIYAPDIWLSALKLATMWHFSDIRRLAIQELTKALQTSADLIVHARNFHVPEWLELGCRQLVQRLEPFTVDEGVKLGMETTVRLVHLREEIRKTNSPGSREQAHLGPRPVFLSTLKIIVRQAFAEELRIMEHDNAVYQ